MKVSICITISHMPKGHSTHLSGEFYSKSNFNAIVASLGLGAFFLGCPFGYPQLENKTPHPAEQRGDLLDSDTNEVLSKEEEDSFEQAAIPEAAPSFEDNSREILKRFPLALFFEKLRALETKETDEVQRILFYGDSHTAADVLPHKVRTALQQRFGDGGRGFVLLGKPWRSYRPIGIATTAEGSWDTQRAKATDSSGEIDGRYGLGGVAVDGRGPYSRTTIALMRGADRKRVKSVEIFYLRQPGGGDFFVSIDGKGRVPVETDYPEFATGSAMLRDLAGMSRLVIHLKNSRPVRLFGAAIENSGPGIVLDTLGINGAFFYTPLKWEPQILTHQIAVRKPALIITMYGANEVDSQTLTKERYEDRIAQTLDLLRSGALNAACLVLGPLDRIEELDRVEERTESSENQAPSKLEWIVEAQESVSQKQGCGFINLQELMGGPGSHRDWQRRGLAHKDGVHLTASGYELMGDILLEEIYERYEKYLEKNKIQGKSEMERRI